MVNQENVNSLKPKSTQTLRVALNEYYNANKSLLQPTELKSDVAALFRQHDAGHVVFGCDTSLRGETLIDTWTIFATTAGFRGYMQYFKHAEVNQIFADVGYWQIFVEFVKCVPSVFRVLLRSLKMTKRWPWADFEDYLDQPLSSIREQYNIKVV